MPVISSSHPKYWSFRSTLVHRLQLIVNSGQPPADGFHHRDRDAVARLFVYLVIGLDGQHPVDPVIAPALQPQALPRCEAADALA